MSLRRASPFFANGTAAAPSISFLANRTTGLYWATGSILNVSCGGTKVASFDPVQAAFRVHGAGWQIQNGIGAVTTPGYSFITDNSSGMFYSGGGLVKFSTLGVLALTLDGSQNATFIGTVISAASAAARAGFRMPHGAAPTAPADGDWWTTTAGVFVRVNGVTKTVTLT